MKKIEKNIHSLVIFTSVFPVGSKAVSGIFVYKIAKFLKASYNVHIFFMTNQFSYFKFLGMKKEPGIHKDFTFTILPYISLGFPAIFKAVPQLFSAFFFGLFLIPSDSKRTYYGKFKFGAMLAVLFSKFKGGTSFGDFGESDFNRSSLFYPNFLLRYVLKNINSAICLNKNIYNIIKEVRGNSDGIYLLYNGVDLNSFTPFIGPKINSKKIKCLFVGHFIPRKGIKEASSAILLANKLGSFIGSGPLKPSGSHVIKSETVDHFDLPSYYQNADVFVFPSYNEGSPNALIEAISAGLPIVGWDLSFMRDHTNKDFAILVEPGDVKGLADAINFICEKPNIYNMMSISARNYACSNFSLSERNNKILKIIKEAK